MELLEVFRSKFSHVNGKAIKGIQLPTEFSHHGRILPDHNVLCWIEDVEIAAEAFLFHPDDLTRLIAPSQNGETSAPTLLAASPLSTSEAVAPTWTVKKPKRSREYNFELYDLLCEFRDKGMQCPSAHKVMDEWQKKQTGLDFRSYS